MNECPQTSALTCLQETGNYDEHKQETTTSKTSTIQPLENGRASGLWPITTQALRDVHKVDHLTAGPKCFGVL